MGLASYKLSQVWWQLYCVLLDCRQLYFAPSPLRRQTATASAEMISNRFSKMSVARLLPYIISLKWRGKKEGANPQINHNSPLYQMERRGALGELVRACVCVRGCVWVCVLKTCREGQLWDVHRPVSARSHLPWRMVKTRGWVGIALKMNNV